MIVPIDGVDIDFQYDESLLKHTATFPDGMNSCHQWLITLCQWVIDHKMTDATRQYPYRQEWEGFETHQNNDSIIDEPVDWLINGFNLHHHELSSLLSSLSDVASIINQSTLELAKYEIKNLPNEIGYLTHLHYLGLSQNLLTDLPHSLSALKKLTSLSLANNDFTEIPNVVFKLTHLETLNCRNLKLTKLPEEIGELTNLRRLYLSGNKLSSIPESIGNLSHLTELDISNTALTALPKSFEKLKKLTKLNLSKNSFTNIPNEIYSLTQLNHIDLSENFITEINEKINKLIRLRYFSLNDNLIKLLPLTTIDQLVNKQGTKLLINNIQIQRDEKPSSKILVKNISNLLY
jgi:Leucine-rich repeat (LRR) protein